MVAPSSPPAVGLARNLAEMWGASRRWRNWRAAREIPRPLVWAHCPSVGEAMAAQAVLGRMRARVGGFGVVMTHTSPSVSPWRDRWNLDNLDYLPLPLPLPGGGPVGRLVRSLSPELIVSARGEVWPAMALAASQLGVPLAIIAGSLRVTSSRLRPAARWVLRSTYRSVTMAAVARPEDANGWARLGVDPNRIHVVGDPRDDLILEAPLDPVASRLSPWSAAGAGVGLFASILATESGLAREAATRVRNRYPRCRMLLVPHRPADADGVASDWRSAGFMTMTWPGESEAAPPPLEVDTIVVDRTGLLASLYQFATVAYVGGGFRPRGPHSLSEPAAFGVPTAVGPSAAEGGESRRFVGRGAVVLTSRRPAEELAERWLEWLDEPVERWRVGLAGRGVLDAGAADRTAALLAKLLPTSSGVVDDGPGEGNGAGHDRTEGEEGHEQITEPAAHVDLQSRDL